MLVNFTVKNYRSFKEDQTFSMEASSVKEHKRTVFKKGKHGLLPLPSFMERIPAGKAILLQLSPR